jgi:hypothetical protein
MLSDYIAIYPCCSLICCLLFWPTLDLRVIPVHQVILTQASSKISNHTRVGLEPDTWSMQLSDMSLVTRTDRSKLSQARSAGEIVHVSPRALSHLTMNVFCFHSEYCRNVCTAVLSRVIVAIISNKSSKSSALSGMVPGQWLDGTSSLSGRTCPILQKQVLKSFANQSYLSVNIINSVTIFGMSRFNHSCPANFVVDLKE